MGTDAGVSVSVSPCVSFTYTNAGQKSDQPVIRELVKHSRAYRDEPTITETIASSRLPSSRDPQVRHDRLAGKRVNIHISHTHTCGRPSRVATIRDMWTCGLEFDQPGLSRADTRERARIQGVPPFSCRAVLPRLHPFFNKLLAIA